MLWAYGFMYDNLLQLLMYAHAYNVKGFMKTFDLTKLTTLKSVG
jgi:pantothenate kinase